MIAGFFFIDFRYRFSLETPSADFCAVRLFHSLLIRKVF